MLAAVTASETPQLQKVTSYFQSGTPICTVLASSGSLRLTNSSHEGWALVLAGARCETAQRRVQGCMHVAEKLDQCCLLEQWDRCPTAKPPASVHAETGRPLSPSGPFWKEKAKMRLQWRGTMCAACSTELLVCGNPHKV